jgi:hypothetical protein
MCQIRSLFVRSPFREEVRAPAAHFRVFQLGHAGVEEALEVFAVPALVLEGCGMVSAGARAQLGSGSTLQSHLEPVEVYPIG